MNNLKGGTERGTKRPKGKSRDLFFENQIA